MATPAREAIPTGAAVDIEYKPCLSRPHLSRIISPVTRFSAAVRPGHHGNNGPASVRPTPISPSPGARPAAMSSMSRGPATCGIAVALQPLFDRGGHFSPQRLEQLRVALIELADPALKQFAAAGIRVLVRSRGTTLAALGRQGRGSKHGVSYIAEREQP